MIKEQNALDALVMIENYCHLLAERSELIANSREWESPADLKEAASTLIFAASRTGEFPELHEIRRVLTSKYGKDFACSAVELRNDCSVYPKVASMNTSLSLFCFFLRCEKYGLNVWSSCFFFFRWFRDYQQREQAQRANKIWLCRLGKKMGSVYSCATRRFISPEI